MELVPIIYTALIIFAVLAVATIVISYLLFKLRGKDKELDEEEAGSLPEYQPQIIKSKSSSSKNKVTTDNHKEKHKSSSRKNYSSSHKRKKPQTHHKKVKPNPIKDNKRIQILNSPAKNDIPSQSNNKTSSKPVTTDAKKYSDGDTEFYRLDTTGKNNKK